MWRVLGELASVNLLFGPAGTAVWLLADYGLAIVVLVMVFLLKKA